ncbi:MAG: hypothetical protein IPG97_15760 [Microthrixaceae bacterium]|nr:hypothetical protein [Microthrixaceae bacterium]
MGIQDNFWTIGEETVEWGTKATTLTRGVENQTDDATPNVEFLQSRGMRPATVATPTGRSVAVPRGGQHVLTLDLMAKSLGLVFASVASTVATTTPGGATLTRLHTFTPTTTGPTKSFTVHAGRADVGGTVNHHDYLGCMAESLNLALTAKGLPVLKSTFAYKTLDTAAASVTPSYPTSSHVYRDIDCVVSIDGNSECLRSADFHDPDRARHGAVADLCGWPREAGAEYPCGTDRHSVARLRGRFLAGRVAGRDRARRSDHHLHRSRDRDWVRLPVSGDVPADPAHRVVPEGWPSM